MSRSVSRAIVEISMIAGVVSVAIGVVQKLINVSTVYLSTIMGLTPADFMLVAVVCFLFALAATGRRVLKYLELKKD